MLRPDWTFAMTRAEKEYYQALEEWKNVAVKTIEKMQATSEQALAMLETLPERKNDN